MLILNQETYNKANRTQIAQLERARNKRMESLYGDKGFQALCVNAGTTPELAYQYVDSETKIATTPKGEFATWQLLQGTARSISLGYEDYVYRRASAQEGGTVSMSGNTGITTDKVDYNYQRACVPIIDHGTSRSFRENLMLTHESFDSWLDDARESRKTLFRTSNDYLWEGNASVKSKNGVVWLGLRGDPSLVQTTTAIDMASTAVDGKTIVDEIAKNYDVLWIDNNVSGGITLAISQQMWSYWSRTPYAAAQPAFGTIMDAVRKLGFVDVYADPKLVGGKQFLMAEFSLSGLHALTGQAVSSYMAERPLHNSPHTMVNWMAQGYVAKSDFVGKKTALYCKSA